MHPWNREVPSVMAAFFSLVGKAKLFSAVLTKALVSILLTLEYPSSVAKLTLSSVLQSSKALRPMVVTEAGMVIVVRLLQA